MLIGMVNAREMHARRQSVCLDERNAHRDPTMHDVKESHQLQHGNRIGQRTEIHLARLSNDQMGVIITILCPDIVLLTVVF